MLQCIGSQQPGRQALRVGDSVVVGDPRYVPLHLLAVAPQVLGETRCFVTSGSQVVLISIHWFVSLKEAIPGVLVWRSGPLVQCQGGMVVRVGLVEGAPSQGQL